MARIRIDFPDQYCFSVELPVRISDLNYGNHVGNDAILSLMQEARALWFSSMDFTSEVEIQGSIGQVVADAAVIYKSESFFGDILVISLGVQEIGKYGYEVIYRITNKITGNEVARGKTGMVCFDYSNRKMVQMPDGLRIKLSAQP